MNFVIYIHSTYIRINKSTNFFKIRENIVKLSDEFLITEGPRITLILGLQKKTRYAKFALVGL